MVAGLPGTGIGGIFYLLSVFVMPFREIFYTLNGRSNKRRWGFVGRQMGLAIGILTGFWLTGLLIGLIIHGVDAGQMKTTHPYLYTAMRIHPMVISLFTLLSVLMSAWVVSLIVRRVPSK